MLYLCIVIKKYFMKTNTKASDAIKAFYLGLKTSRDTARDILSEMMEGGAYFPSAEAVINTAKRYTVDANIIAAIQAELDSAPVL